MRREAHANSLPADHQIRVVIHIFSKRGSLLDKLNAIQIAAKFKVLQKFTPSHFPSSKLGQFSLDSFFIE